MRRHVLTAGRLTGIRSTDADHDGRTFALLTIANADGTESDSVVASHATAQAIAVGGLLFADVEVCLSRAGETTPADGERARYLAASADVARLERALATAESARDDWRREADHHASLGSEYLRVMALLAVWADAARRGEFVADEPTSADIGDDVLRELAVDVYAALRSLDPQRPHGPAADAAPGADAAPMRAGGRR